MPFQFTRTHGDFSASGTGSGDPGRLGIGDLATVHVSDPDLSDLSGVTVQYNWWVGSTLAGHGTTLAITALDAGLDVKVSISFTHHDFSVTGNVTVTEHELGVVHFGAADSLPNANDDTAELPVGTAHAGTHGNVLLNDTDPNADALAVTHVATGSIGAPHATQYGTFELDANGDFH
ncbi:MAG TPA: Ig-like domain-containing protein, partial [Ramlibacter sp.]